MWSHYTGAFNDLSRQVTLCGLSKQVVWHGVVIQDNLARGATVSRAGQRQQPGSVVTSPTLSQLTPSMSTKILISSGIAIEGCVSFN